MMTGEKSWRNTQLWLELQSRASSGFATSETASALMPEVSLWLNDIAAVLAKAHTDRLEFTLHDHEHAFRVAERMWTLIEKDDRDGISDYEIALLLLAAYLHDIGMVPERRRITAIRDYVLCGQSILTPAEIAELQTWLDESDEEDVIPIAKSNATPANLARAEEITTYFVRHKHNDWSSEWIEHMKGRFHLLTDWKQVLLRLCQSHHWDFPRLQAPDFDPRRVGGLNAQSIHLRYMACLLRLADILENDPERVPSIILRHRNVEDTPRSLVHWQIPHDLSIVVNNGRVHLAAFPTSARHEKAIRDLADAIDRELYGCAQLAENGALVGCPGLAESSKQWQLSPACIRDIRPKDDAYEFIDGAFRPNTAKLLQLLSGTQLYDQRFAAIRELLQNSFDSVREKLARKHLLRDAQLDDNRVDLQSDDEVVLLTLESEEDGQLRLVCKDSGCGMTKSIIRDHLLVSGDGHRPALVDLERRCRSRGITLGRTGQFGIGVLSYFMMASKIQIITTRDQICGDVDAPGWVFSTNGVGDFGELRRLRTSSGCVSGTQTEWWLRSPVTNIERLVDGILTYLQEQLVRIPCRFQFDTRINGSHTVRWCCQAGWTASHDEIIEGVFSDGWPDPTKGDDAPDSQEDDASEEDLMNASEVRLARERVRVVESTIQLPNRCGLARVAVAWLDLPEGPSLAFVPLRNRNHRHEIIEPTAVFRMAWKGMKCHLSNRSVRHEPEDSNFPDLLASDEFQDSVWISYDFINLDPKNLSVSRTGIAMTKEAQRECFSATSREAERLMAEIESARQPRRFFELINDYFLRRDHKLAEGQGWFQYFSSDCSINFERIHLPVAIGDSLFRLAGRLIIAYGAQRLCVLPDRGDHKSRLAFEIKGCSPHRIVANPYRESHNIAEIRPVAIWDRWSTGTTLHTAAFPPEWLSIWGCDIAHNSGVWSHRIILNRDHWAIRILSQSAQEAVALEHHFDLDSLPDITAPEDVARFLIEVSKKSDSKRWRQIESDRPGYLHQLWVVCAEVSGLKLEDLELRILHGCGTCFTSRFGHRRQSKSALGKGLGALIDGNRPRLGHGLQALTSPASEVASSVIFEEGYAPAVTDSEWLIHIARDGE